MKNYKTIIAVVAAGLGLHGYDKSGIIHSIKPGTSQYSYCCRRRIRSLGGAQRFAGYSGVAV